MPFPGQRFVALLVRQPVTMKMRPMSMIVAAIAPALAQPPPPGASAIPRPARRPFLHPP
jgi:hypothetical protein